MENNFYIEVKHRLLIYIYYLLARFGIGFRWLLRKSLKIELEEEDKNEVC